LSFRIGNELLGIDVTKVKEINRNIEYTVVPKAPKRIVGLFNMRGQIVTLFNLSYMLGVNFNSEYEKVTCIILKDEPGSPNQKGLVIEKSGDVIDVTEDMCELLPANMNSLQSKYIKSVIRLKKELLRLVETDILFAES
jgi:purine-binding chemotaxis protein CheW